MEAEVFLVIYHNKVVFGVERLKIISTFYRRVFAQRKLRFFFGADFFSQKKKGAKGDKMKAWKKGAIIGGFLALLLTLLFSRPVKLWIYLPVGILIGEVMAAIITGQIETRKKVAILGGLWGILSIGVWFYFSLVSFGHGTASNFVGYLSMILFLPGLLGMVIDALIRDSLEVLLRASFGTPFFFWLGYSR